jgi:hypothetical protein
MSEATQRSSGNTNRIIIGRRRHHKPTPTYDEQGLKTTPTSLQTIVHEKMNLKLDENANCMQREAMLVAVQFARNNSKK